MSANDKQIAGTHYQGTYQHWDFVEDTGIGYLLGCATKYISRWRKKNGTQDLEKALHYLEKYQEKYHYRNTDYQHWDRFIKPMHSVDQAIMLAIYKGDFYLAESIIKETIDREEQPTHGYVNQD